MALQYLCDTCGDPCDREDMHTLTITKVSTNTPSIAPLDLCVFCKEAALKIIQEKIAEQRKLHQERKNSDG